MRKRIWLLALIPLAACGVDRGYDAEPVVGPSDQREVDVPSLDDDDAIGEQKCWRIELWAEGDLVWQEHGDKNIGIACLVEDEADR